MKLINEEGVRLQQSVSVWQVREWEQICAQSYRCRKLFSFSDEAYLQSAASSTFPCSETCPMVTVVEMKWSVFWDITSCSLLKVNPELCLPSAFTLLSCSAYSTLRMEEIYSSETSLDFQRTTRRSIPEDGTESYACCLLSRWYLALLIRPWRWRRYIPPKRRLTFSGLHGDPRTTAVRTSNPTWCWLLYRFSFVTDFNI
jgi:hypothetical protein